MTLREIVAKRLGNETDEKKRGDLNAAAVCLDAKCEGMRQDSIGFGVDMVHCRKHAYKFNVKVPVAGTYRPVESDAGEMTELFK